MTHPLKHVETLLWLMINAGAALVVAGAVLSFISIIEAVCSLIGLGPGYNLSKGVSLSIATAVALYATWKVNGRFITRGD